MTSSPVFRDRDQQQKLKRTKRLNVSQNVKHFTTSPLQLDVLQSSGERFCKRFTLSKPLPLRAAHLHSLKIKRHCGLQHIHSQFTAAVAPLMTALHVKMNAKEMLWRAEIAATILCNNPVNCKDRATLRLDLL